MTVQGEKKELQNKIDEFFAIRNTPVEIVDIDNAPVVSDGGSSSYYQLTITNKQGDTINCEMGDVIRCVFGDNFSLGNIVKACRRVYLRMSGKGGKDGVSVEYDCKKIKWFAGEVAFWNGES